MSRWKEIFHIFQERGVLKLPEPHHEPVTGPFPSLLEIRTHFLFFGVLEGTSEKKDPAKVFPWKQGSCKMCQLSFGNKDWLLGNRGRLPQTSVLTGAIQNVHNPHELKMLVFIKQYQLI